VKQHESGTIIVILFSQDIVIIPMNPFGFFELLILGQCFS
jgi:hypothetical protein